MEEAFEQKTEHMQQTVSGNVSGSNKQEAVLALTALGYSNSEALKAVSKVKDANQLGVKKF